MLLTVKILDAMGKFARTVNLTVATGVASNIRPVDKYAREPFNYCSSQKNIDQIEE